MKGVDGHLLVYVSMIGAPVWSVFGDSSVEGSSADSSFVVLSVKEPVEESVDDGVTEDPFVDEASEDWSAVDGPYVEELSEDDVVSEDWASEDWSAVDGPSLESSSLSGLDLDSWVLDFQIGLLLTFWMLATTMRSVLLVGLGTQ